MSKKNERTVILATARGAWRVDWRRQRGAVRPVVQVVGSIGDGSIAGVLAGARQSGGSFGRRLVVLSTDVWCDLIRFPGAGVSGLSNDDLIQALRFEVETLAGINADDCVLSAAPAAAEDESMAWWVNALPRQDWDGIAEVLTRNGVKSLVLANPSSVAAARTAHSPGEWVAEIWSDICTLKDAQGGVRRIWHVRNDEPALLKRLLAEFPDADENLLDVFRESELTTAFDTAAAADGQLQQTELVTWVENAGRAADAPAAAQVPLLVQREAGQPIWKYGLAASVGLAVLIGFCWWHSTWMKQVEVGLRGEIERIVQPASVKQRYDMMLDSVMQQRTELVASARESTIDLRKVQFLFGPQAERMEKLLGWLVEMRTSDLVVRDIEPGESGVTFSGISIDGQAVPSMASRLRDVVLAVGWRIHPATQIGEKKMVNGGPWTFDVLLEDVGPVDLIESVAATEERTGSSQALPAADESLVTTGGNRP